MRRRLLAVLAFVLAAAPAQAATYYVGKSGSDGNSCSTAQSSAAGSRKLTIVSGMTCLSAGDTLIIGNGTYSDALTSPPSGSSGGGYITIKAENDGGVIATGALFTSDSTIYTQWEGLRFHSTTKEIRGDHHKFKRCEFKNGCSSGNCVNMVVGSNDDNGTADILLEDNWFHGAGGRYNLLIYNSNRVVVRRAVIRHDAGWTDGGSQNPEAGITFYNTSNSAAMNVIVLDSTLTYATWQSAMYNICNSASPQGNDNNQWRSSISFNNTQGSDGAGLRFDGNCTMSGHVLSNLLLWDANAGLNMSFASNVGFSATNLTIGRTNLGSGNAVYGDSGGTKSISSVRRSSTAFTISDITASNVINGLNTYLPVRVTQGADIQNKLGADGTLHGETNYNTDTGSSLWPYPNEARIKQEMCTDVSITRGFCSDTSLTHYLYNALGNGCPVCSGGAAAPTVSSITPASGSTAGGDSVTITGADFVATPTVAIGGVAATGCSFVNSTTLTCTTGAHAAGVVSVVVTNPDAQAGTLSNGFTYATPAFTVFRVRRK